MQSVKQRFKFDRNDPLQPRYNFKNCKFTFWSRENSGRKRTEINFPRR